MKLLTVYYASFYEKAYRFYADIEGSTEELNVLNDKLRESGEMLSIHYDGYSIHPGLSAFLEKDKKEINQKLTHILSCSFSAKNGEILDLIVDIAGNIQHLID